MSKIQKTIKIPEEAHQAAEEWILKNNSVINFSVLAEMAIRKLISEPVTLKPVLIEQEKALELTKQAMTKHKTALDRMK